MEENTEQKNYEYTQFSCSESVKCNLLNRTPRIIFKKFLRLDSALSQKRLEMLSLSEYWRELFYEKLAFDSNRINMAPSLMVSSVG